MSNLSENDRGVLNAIFNPNLPLTEAYDEDLTLILKDNEAETPETNQTKQMEKDSIEKAESGNLDEALDLLSKAIKITPNRPSLYNNRAQVYQFKGRIKDAFDDLRKALELCESNEYERTKCQSLCQRGLLYRKEGNTDLARRDFSVASQMGSKFAKSQLVELNPYAALCNQMLTKMMDNFKTN